MTQCCNEGNCRRKQPYKLYRGFFSGAVLLGTRYTVTDNEDGTGTWMVSEKHDVSASMETFIRENPDYVRSILNDKTREDLTDLADFALLGAHNDPCPDKSDWIRIWVFARRRAGLQFGSDAWEEAYSNS